MDDTTETLADRLNSEPVIFRGSSSSELAMILTIAVMFWLPTGLIGAWLLGAPLMGLGFAGLGVLVTVFFGATAFQKIKRGRPDQYYQHRALLLLDEWKIRKTSMIHRSGAWSLGRMF